MCQETCAYLAISLYIKRDACIGEQVVHLLCHDGVPIILGNTGNCLQAVLEDVRRPQQSLVSDLTIPRELDALLLFQL